MWGWVGAGDTTGWPQFIWPLFIVECQQTVTVPAAGGYECLDGDGNELDGYEVKHSQYGSLCVKVSVLLRGGVVPGGV